MKLNFVAIILQNFFLLVYGKYYPIVILIYMYNFAS